MKGIRFTLRRYRLTYRAKLRWWLMVVGCVAFATGLATLRPACFAAGAVLLTAGMVLHFVAKGHLRQNVEVTRTGPYRYVRHPFYLANLAIDLGLCAMIGRAEIAIPYLLLFALVYARVIRDEERTLERLFGSEYREYQARVPLILPWRRPRPAPEGCPGFSWRNPNLACGIEISRLLDFASYPLVFWIVGGVREGGGAALLRDERLLLTSLGVLLSLVCLSLASRIVFKRRSLAVPRWIASRPCRLGFAMFVVALLLMIRGAGPDLAHRGAPVFAAAAAVLLLPLPLARLLTTAGRAFVAEALLLVEACVLAGLPFLMAVPIAWYSVLGAGRRLPTPAVSHAALTTEGASRPNRPPLSERYTATSR